MIQVGPMNSRDLKFLDLTALSLALQNDPDLSGLEPHSLPQIMQTLFVCTGCDYVSFIKGMGKATFLRYFFQYASFISGPNSQGFLSDIELHNDSNKKGFLAFFRLVGTVYLRNMQLALTHIPHFLKYAQSTQTVDWRCASKHC